MSSKAELHKQAGTVEIGVLSGLQVPNHLGFQRTAAKSYPHSWFQPCNVGPYRSVLAIYLAQVQVEPQVTEAYLWVRECSLS